MQACFFQVFLKLILFPCKLNFKILEFFDFFEGSISKLNPRMHHFTNLNA